MTVHRDLNDHPKQSHRSCDHTVTVAQLSLEPIGIAAESELHNRHTLKSAPRHVQNRVSCFTMITATAPHH